MASFLTDLAKPYVEKLINGAIAESSYICCFTCIAKDFEEERARLEIESSTVKQRVDVATRRGEDVQRNVLSWEEEADKLIEDDTKTNQKCFFGFCPHCIWRYRRGKELANKKENMKKLLETGKELAIGLPACLPDVERYSSQHFISFKSRESKYIELLNVLKDDDNYIIGLQGMGGTGKTTLVKEVGKKLKQSKQFTQIIDTTVSFSPDIKRIQDDISGPLGLKLDDCNESDRPKKLWSRLTNGEKILLILDDVWGDIDFNEIGIPYSDNHKGCRILVTTRNLLVCNRLGCSKTIQLDLLCEEDAWIMFQKHAGLSKISTKKLLEKGRKIANECKRLPVAIAAIASSLKGEQRQEEWDVALNSLQKHMSMHGDDDELLKIYKCFQVSYDNMKNEKAKRLFLMCSVFRDDEEISTEMLTRFGIGAGLFGEDYGSYEDARSQVVISKNKLLDSCLLLEANQSRVKMHDLVRDAAQWIANKEIQTVRLYDKNQKAMVEREMNIKYLLCEGKLKDVFSFKLDGSKPEILIVAVHKDEECHDVKIEVPNSFFENSKGLRVFHLIYDCYPQLALSLPQSIQSLKNIRSLLFKRAYLGDISILGNLQSLETLDLDGCEIDELPHGITKLEKLKLLNLKYCEIARNNPFEVIEGCSSLEELYFINSFNGFCREITFPKLPRFHVGDYLSSVDESSSKYVYFQNKDDVFLSETTLKYCMQEAEVLRLRRIEGGWRNIIPEIVPMDQGMNNLVELGLECISQLQCLIDTKHIDSHVSNVFSNLVVLKLDRMENLEELFNGPISLDSLKNLEKLSIKDCKHLRSLFKCKINLCNLKTIKLQNCPMLASLFQSLTSRSLVLLEKLQIANCEGLEKLQIANCEELFSGPISLDSLKNLKKLSIKNCKHLRSLFKFKLNLCSLKTIKLQNCPMLASMFQSLTSGSLVLLEKLQIAHCERLKNIIIDGWENDNKSHDSMFPNLKVFDFEECPRLESMLPFLSAQELPVLEAINIRSCDGLKYIFGQYHSTLSYRLHICERVQCLPIQSYSLCNIKEINLSHLLKIKSVFILSITPRMLLETLTIKNCDELQNIIINTVNHDSGGNNWGDVFPNLKRIYVEDCNKLEYIFGHYNHDHQSHNEIHLNLPELKCINLCNLRGLVAMCTKQYRTTFPPLVELEHNGCSHVAIKSFRDFTIHPISKSLDSTIMKEYGDGQIPIEDVNLEGSHETTHTNNQDGTEGQGTSGHELDSSHENGIESNEFQIVETTIKQTAEVKQEFVENNVCGLEITSVANSPTNSQCLKEIEDQSIQEGSRLEKTAANTLSTIPDSRKESSIQLVAREQKGNNLCFEDITTLTNAKRITSPTHSEPNISSSGSLVTYEHKTFSQEQEVDGGHSLETTKDNDNRVSLNGDAFMKVISIAKDQIPKDDPSPSNSLLLPFEGNPSQKVKGLSPPSLATPSLATPSLLIAITEPVTTEDVDVKDSHETIMTNNNDQVSINDDNVMKVSSNIKDQFSKDDDILVSKSIPSSIASHFPSKPSEGDPSQIDEDLCSSLVVKRELENLVSKNHLATENLFLLTDFLVKHPSRLLSDSSLSSRYKSYAYNCLAELLKFLQTHSVLDVLGSSSSEFVELLQDVRKCGFDKDWLDGVEKRALFSDLRFSQNAMQKLLDSEQHVTKEVEDLKHQLTVSKAVLETIIQQKAHVLETKAALSAPLGY